MGPARPRHTDTTFDWRLCCLTGSDVAVVVAKPEHIVDPANILAALKTTVANFKIPKWCAVVAEPSGSATVTVQKSVLRVQYANLLATGAS